MASTFYKKLLSCLEQNDKSKYDQVLAENRSKRISTELINYEIVDKETILCRACEWGSILMVKFLIEKCKISAQSILPESGMTPLTCACKGGHFEVVKYLLEQNIDVKILTNNGAKTCLHILAENVIDQKNGDWKSTKDTEGFDPVKCCKLFIDKGVDLEHKDGDGRTAFLVLVQNFVEMSFNEVDDRSYKPDRSCYDIIFELLNLLFDSGVDIDASDNEGRTALHYVACKVITFGKALCVTDENRVLDFSKFLPSQYGIMDLAKLLLRRNADVFIKDNTGLNPMYHSVLRGSHDMFILYLKTRDLPLAMKVELIELKAAEAIIEDPVFTKTYMPYLALALRFRNESDLARPCITSMNAFFNDFEEPQSIFELQLFEEDYHNVMKLACVIYSRVLGEHHEETLDAVKSFLDFMDEDRDDDGFFPDEVKLAREYLLIARKTHGTANVRTLEAAIYMAEKICSPFVTSHTVKDLMECYQGLVETIKSVINNKDAHRQEKDLTRGLNTAAYNLYMLSLLNLPVSRTNKLIKQFMELIQLYPVGKNLFQILTYGIIWGLQEKKVYFKPFFNLMQLFLKESNLVVIEDEHGGTVLHVLFCGGNEDLVVEDVGQLEEFVSLMLRAGLHIDSKNRQGKTLAELLGKWGLQYNDPKYRTLQCLSAVVVADNKIKHEDIPQHLKEFIQMHSSEKQ